jgi:hypothetical protein
VNTNRSLGVMTAALAAALIAGCGGSSSVGAVHTATRTPASSTTATSRAEPPTKPSMLAFAKCMRAHGVPNFPDPKPPGEIPTVHVTEPAPSGGFTANPNSPAYQAASNDCRPLADASPVAPGGANQVIASQLKFAVCMRGHGVPNFPDPTSTGEIGDDGAIDGVNQNSPAFQSAEKTCGKAPGFRPG